jgi:tRNA(fMet)-specific endonuclease VapC
MPHLIDTNVAIHLRDSDMFMEQRVATLPDLPVLSVVTQVELEGGVYRDPAWAAVRRNLLDGLLSQLTVLDFTQVEAEAYGAIIAATGYSRRKINDRMIAATALAHNFTLITLNGDDFRDIPALKLEVWG